MQLTRRTSGFTVVELTTVIIIIPLIIAIFIMTLYNLSDNSRRDTIQLSLDDRLQFAMDTIESDVRLGSEYYEELPSDFSDSYAPGTGWSFAGAGENSRVILMARPVTTIDVDRSDQALVYVDSPGFDCTTQLQLNPVLNYMLIYFVDDGDLIRRTLVDSTTTTCDNEAGRQKQSCPRELQATWASGCEARDEIIASDVSQFSVDYYHSRATDPAPDVYTNSDPGDLDDINDAQITLKLSKLAGGKEISSSLTLRISRLNDINV